MCQGIVIDHGFLEVTILEGYQIQPISLGEKHTKGYADLLREQEYITSRISGNTKDPITQRKARRALSRANQAWINVNVSGYSLQNIEFKSLELTPQEAVLYMAYREAAFSVFYRCCAMVYDFQLTSGRITRENGRNA